MSEFEKVATEFLKRVCRIAYGNTTKSIEIIKVWKDLKIDDQSDYPSEIIVMIVQSLKEKQFIQEGSIYDQITVTRSGINHIISMHQELATYYGVVSMEELEKLYPGVLEFISNRTADDIEAGISVSEIKTEKLNPYAETVLYQMIDFLKDKGFVDHAVGKLLVDHTELGKSIKITMKGKEELERIRK